MILPWFILQNSVTQLYVNYDKFTLSVIDMYIQRTLLLVHNYVY